MTTPPPPARPPAEERGPALLIPAFQAARCLPGLLAEVADRLPGLPVLVVDDGSTDGTARAARAAGAEVFRHLRNQGKGAALARGWTLLFRRGHAAVLCLDADGQHDPAEAGAFLDLWQRERPDLIVGDRNLGQASMPWDRRLSNRISTHLLRRRTGLPLTDSQCGYRLLARPLWEGLRLRGRAYDQESELLLQAAALGARVSQVPVVQRPARAPSHVRRGPDLVRFLARLLQGAAALKDEDA